MPPRTRLTDIHPVASARRACTPRRPAVPALVVRAPTPDVPHALEAALFGTGDRRRRVHPVVGGRGRAAGHLRPASRSPCSRSIAVLPEYAVDFVFAWQGGNSFEAYGRPACPARAAERNRRARLALANMTGANRLLIGIGWSMVVFIAWYRIRVRATAAASAKRLAGHPARPQPLGRARVPRRRHDLLADACR